MHGMRLREIVLDLSPGPPLRSRQLKRQPPDQRKGETTRLFDRRLKHGSPARLALTVVLAHGELLRQQLVEFHAPPGRQRAAAESLLIRSGAGMMQGVDGLEKTAQAEPLRHLFRQRVIELCMRERAFDQTPQRCLAKAGRDRKST